jgi:hypothetical protein
MTMKIFAGQLYDKKGHIVVFLPGTILILIAMVLCGYQIFLFSLQLLRYMD